MQTQTVAQTASHVAPQNLHTLQSYATLPTHRTQQKLQAAQQKLLAPHSPLLLRTLGFLRISCSLLEETGAYSKLLKALSEENSAWWETCEITPGGSLQSSHPNIHQILTPILNLYSVEY
jgi:hypothetical protein